MPSLEFDNLPLIEVAVRVTFNASRPITYALVNSIYKDLQPTFPTITEPRQLEVAPGTTSEMEIGVGFLPGAIFTDHKEGISISLQSQVIVARWINHRGLKDRPYPHYKALRDALWLTVESFGKASVGGPGIEVVNMSYVNFIELSGQSMIREYLSDQAQISAMGQAKVVRKLEASWSDGDHLDVRFSLEQAIAKLPERPAHGFRLTTAAGLRLGSSDDARSGLDKVHETLQIFFDRIISDKAKAEWGKRVSK